MVIPVTVTNSAGIHGPNPVNDCAHEYISKDTFTPNQFISVFRSASSDPIRDVKNERRMERIVGVELMVDHLNPSKFSFKPGYILLSIDHRE